MVLKVAAVIVLLIIAVLVAGFVWKKKAGFEVAGHSWKRQIAIERFGPVPDSAWCDSMPFGARGVTRTREVRSQNRVPNGEDCHMRKVDQGNGTFTEREECSPKYRDEPVYDERCHYLVDRWDAFANGHRGRCLGHGRTAVARRYARARRELRRLRARRRAHGDVLDRAEGRQRRPSRRARSISNKWTSLRGRLEVERRSAPRRWTRLHEPRATLGGRTRFRRLDGNRLPERTNLFEIVHPTGGGQRGEELLAVAATVNPIVEERDDAAVRLACG